MNKVYVLIAAAVIIAAGSWWYYTSLNIETARNDALPAAVQPRGGHEESPPDPAVEVSAHGGDENLAEFVCAGGSSMIAVFSRDLVDITLSDGRQLTLSQVESGSGIRYANASGAIEFHSKGEEAFLQEDGETTFADCTIR